MVIADISHFHATPDDGIRPARLLAWGDFRGWPAVVMTQGPLELTVVPSIGGRLMSIRHAGIELAYINDALAGCTPDGSAPQWKTLCGQWDFPLWGGGKTWVAPESQWPDGAPQSDLDSGSYNVVDTWCVAGSMGIELHSSVCRQSGLQIVRRIELSDSGTWTTLHRLINRSNHVQDCGIWDVLMLRRPGIVSVRLDTPGGDTSSLHDYIVPFPDKGPVGDLCGSRFLRYADGVLSTVCDEAMEFKLGINSAHGELEVCLSQPEGDKYLTRRFDSVEGAHYLHGAAIEVFNAPVLPYFEIESHGSACRLEPGAACDFRVEESVS